MSLIHTFPPHADEAPLGYYRRLASKNLLFGWKDMAAIAGVSRYRSSLMGHPSSVAAATGIKAEWAAAVHDRDLAQRKWRSLYRDDVDAVCPHCISSSSYIRAVWEHSFVTVCPQHRCELLDSCDRCGETLKNTRPHIEHCRCGRDLRLMNAQPVTGARLWVAQLIAGVPADAFGEKLRLAAVTAPAIAGLVQALSQLHHPAATSIPRNAGLPSNLRAAVDFLQPLDGLLANWPQNFEAHVQDRIAHGHPTARTISSLLGLWFQKLKRFCADSELEIFLRVVAQTCATHAPHLVCLDQTAALATGASGYMLLRDASSKLGVRAEVLARAIDSELVAGRTKPFGSQRTLYEIHASEVERIQLSRQDWCNEEQACQMLGVPPSVLELMCAAEVIVADPAWKSDLLKGGKYSVSSVQALVTKLLAVPRQSKGDDTIELRAINSRRLGERKSLVRLMAAIGNGEIHPVTGPSHSVGLLRFNRDDVARHLGSVAVDAGLTITQLSALTGWKHESISHWIRTGLLQAETVKLRGQPCRVVMPAQLLEFNRTFMPAADLARQLGWQASSLSLKLPTLTIHGAQILPNGARRGGLVALADLAANAASHLACS